MKKAAACDAVFVAVFALFVALPNLHFSREEVSTKENRTLAVFKPLFIGGKVNETFAADFEAFYADRFFTREALLALSHALTSRFVVSKQTIGNERVLIGQDGWLFGRDDNAEQNFMNIKYFSKNELYGIFAYMNGIKRFCDERGKKFVFFIGPDKSRIYGEFYPKLIPKQKPDTSSRTFQLINYIKSNSDMQVVYPYERLMREKSGEDLLFYKHDAHWSAIGAYYGYEELCRALQIDLIKIVGWQETKDPHNLTELFPDGTTPDIETIYKVPNIDSQFSQTKEYDELSYEKSALFTECKDKQLNAVFFCDSFSWGNNGLKRYISGSFSTVKYFRRYNFKIVKSDLEDLNKADVIVFECHESWLDKLAPLTFPTFD